MTSAHSIEATFNYIAPMAVEPEYFLYEPDSGTVKNEPVPDPRLMPVEDIRGREAGYALDVDGFAAIEIDTAVESFARPELVQHDYYPAVAKHVRDATGACHVHVFDHNFRSHRVSDRTTSDDRPVMQVHNDYTEISAPQRIRDLLPADEAKVRLTNRYMFINLWRPVNHSVRESPLGICSARSIRQEDFVTLALRYRDRDGQIYFMRHNPAHHWYYWSNMATNEALLLKCFDSARDGRARYTVHSAFVDPTSPSDAPPRESIEVRTIAFFDE